MCSMCVRWERLLAVPYTYRIEFTDQQEIQIMANHSLAHGMKTITKDTYSVMERRNCRSKLCKNLVKPLLKNILYNFLVIYTFSKIACVFVCIIRQSFIISG